MRKHARGDAGKTKGRWWDLLHAMDISQAGMSERGIDPSFLSWRVFVSDRLEE